MTNNIQEPTSAKLREEIRRLASLGKSTKEFFSWEEMKKICLKINSSSGLRFLGKPKNGRRTSNEKVCHAQDIFPKYLDGWVHQTTISTHPTKENLKTMHRLLLAINTPEKKTLSEAQESPKVQQLSRSIVPHWKQNLISAIKSLPDNTNYWSGKIIGVGQVSINTRGKYDE